MKLERFMKKAGLKDEELAGMIGKHRTTVVRLRTGKAKPSFEVMAALERITEGLVKPSDFVESSQ